MKKIVSILLSTIIFCSLFAVPLSVGAKTINIESSSSADCEEGYRFVEIYKSGITKDGWEYDIIKEQNINTDEYKFFAAIGSYKGTATTVTLPTKISTETGTYNVLKYYAQSEKWKEAWIRYYKAIYRDTRGRLKTFTNDIYKVLYQISNQKNEKNMRYEINKMILNWVQSFSYGREKDINGSDFSPIPQILQGAVSDCDSRSILACAMLNQIGIESVLFISREYSHAIYGANVKNVYPAENARINIGEKSFLLCETTKKSLNPGLISKDMSDENKWISVIFN